MTCLGHHVGGMKLGHHVGGMNDLLGHHVGGMNDLFRTPCWWNE